MATTAPARIQEKRLREALGARYGTQFRAHAGRVVGTIWPKDEQDLVALVQAAARASSPLVPRGIGSSPYAAWEASAGLIVSFEHMDAILHVDLQRQLVTVQPGVVWQTLIDYLRPLGLMPRVYPSSGLVSTVGGFVAQGGAGIGSFQFGWVGQTVESARLIDARGHAVNLDGTRVDLTAGTEGRMGLLSEITLRLQPLEPMVGLVGMFDEIAQLEACTSTCAKRGLALWSLGFIDRQAAHVDAGLGLARQPLLSPTKHSLLLSFRRSDELRMAIDLRDAVVEAGGSVSTETAAHERWLGRFMGLQTLHTTPVPMQYRLPAGQIAKLVASIDPETRTKLGFEGVEVNAGSAAVVRFFLLRRHYSNSRNVEYLGKLNPLVRDVGGVPYGTGVFYLTHARAVFGADRLEEFRRFRAEHDPNDLMNPGKGFESSPSEAD